MEIINYGSNKINAEAMAANLAAKSKAKIRQLRAQMYKGGVSESEFCQKANSIIHKAKLKQKLIDFIFGPVGGRR